MLLATLTLFAAPLQSAPGIADGAVRPPALRGGVQAGPSGPLALGRGYRAAFDDAGWRLTPALGAAAAESASFGYRAQTIERGRAVVHRFCENTAAFEPAADGSARVARRAGGVEEYYLALESGIEQCFIIDAPLGGTGDLLVRGALDLTGLEAPLVQDDGALLFPASDVGLRGDAGVRVSDVIGIDADGRTCEGWLSFEDGSLSCGLPAEFVDEAAYPLVVDPLISPVLTLPSGAGALQVWRIDLSYDAATDTTLYVWTEFFSNDDRDLFGQRLAADGTPVGGIIGIEVEPDVLTTDVYVGNDGQASKWMVGTSYSLNGQSSGQYNRLTAVDAASGQPGPPLLIDASASTRVEGVSDATSDGRFLVHIRKSIGSPILLESRAYELQSGDMPALVGSGFSELYAEFGQTVADGPLWISVWDDYENGDDRVRYLLQNSSGGVLDNVFPLGSEHLAEARVDGGDGLFVAVWLELGGPSSTLHARPLRVDGSKIELGDSHVLASSGLAFDLGELEFNGETVSLPYLLGGQVHLLELDLATALPAVPDEVLPAVQALRAPRTTALRTAADPTEDRVVLAWVDTGSPSSGFLTSSSAPRGRAIDLGGGCGAGGRAFAGGASVGNGSFGVSLGGAEPFATSLLVYSRAAANIACGACTIVPDLNQGKLGVVGTTDAIGTARFEAPLPNDPALVGLQLYAQWAQVAAAPACPGFGLDLSDAIEITIE